MVERTVLVSKKKYKRMVTNKISLRDKSKRILRKKYIRSEQATLA
jgi:hypothetical protein